MPSVSDLTLEEKIGQMLCLGWGGPGALLAVNDQAIACVREMRAGAIIVMGRNVQGAESRRTIDAAGIRAMTEELQALADVPLLIATDQEGGRVARLGSPPFTRMPSARIIGAADANGAAAAARATAQELAAVGINWDFAPVADIDSNPANPVIGDRAFGNDPIAVAEMVAAQVRAYEEGGVLPCAKHFPGHGDTSVDSHVGLPTLPFSLAEMEDRELIPFRTAIRADAPTMMSAHIRFPAMDPSGIPATLSRPILTDLLREQLGFRGLLVTDCLEMRAVADGWGTARAAVVAAIAGADCLLICHTLERQREACAALLAAARSGELPIARIDEAVGRVLAAKQRAALLPRPTLDVIGCPEHEAIRRALSGECSVHNAPTTLGAEAPV